MSIRFSILITTKNRCPELLFTLSSISTLLRRPDVECIICNDGSSDDTMTQLQEQYPEIELIHHPQSIGLICSRNKLLAKASGQYAISLDDDAHFLSEHPLETIEHTFNTMPHCGVIAFRIYWGTETPSNTINNETQKRVKGFVGCGHAWNMEAWRSIPDYPDWFIFYGEEDFAAYHLFKKQWQILYVPDILVQHRVNVSQRKKESDYRLRLRRSLRAGWFLMLLFFPMKTIPKRWAYSVWIQLQKRTFKGDFPGTIAILQAMADIVIHLPKIIQNTSTLSVQEFVQYNNLKDTPIYWNPALTH
ncbi:MAG: glycosyltransferase family 2 protein [Bacteroidota bacterium]